MILYQSIALLDIAWAITHAVFIVIRAPEGNRC